MLHHLEQAHRQVPTALARRRTAIQMPAAATGRQAPLQTTTAISLQPAGEQRSQAVLQQQGAAIQLLDRHHLQPM
jgi:hypothetical protein